MVAVIDLGERKVGDGRPCFVIAEAGVNHNGSLESALKLVDAAHAAGADAVRVGIAGAGVVQLRLAAGLDGASRIGGKAILLVS